jgi:hypothetical protein
MLSEDVAEYRRLLEDFHEQIATRDATGARVTENWIRELNDPAFPRHLLAEHTFKVGKVSQSLAMIALELNHEQPQSESRKRLESTQDAISSAVFRIQNTLRKTEYVLADRGLEAIVGEFLSSVEFVMDYVQLRFCGAALTAYRCPHVQMGYQTFLPTDLGYRDALCSLIGATVEDTEIREGSYLRISFSERRSIRVVLDAEETTRRERANFWSTSDRVWSW